MDVGEGVGEDVVYHLGSCRVGRDWVRVLAGVGVGIVIQVVRVSAEQIQQGGVVEVGALEEGRGRRGGGTVYKWVSVGKDAVLDVGEALGAPAQGFGQSALLRGSVTTSTSSSLNFSLLGGKIKLKINWGMI